LGYGSDEAVAALGDGLDVNGRVGDVAQGVAQFHHGGVEAVVEVDEGIGGPEDATEVFAADELAGMLEEIDKHPEGLLADTDGNAVAPQLEIASVDLKDTETPDLRGISLNCLYLTILICGYRICTYMVPMMPFWMTDTFRLKRSGRVSFVDILLLLVATAMAYFERKWLYRERTSQ
jgi:hypothetical protein